MIDTVAALTHLDGEGVDLETAAETTGRFFKTADAETFVAKVAQRARLSDPLDARRIADAVLESLAERISGGEVDDLIAVLPLALRAPLQRGRARSGDTATRLSLDGFLKRVAGRLGVTPLDARRYVEAVFVTLRETIPEPEFLDVTAELPYEYASVGARPQRA